jgi:hypothetical protein
LFSRQVYGNRLVCSEKILAPNQNIFLPGNPKQGGYFETLAVLARSKKGSKPDGAKYGDSLLNYPLI